MAMRVALVGLPFSGKSSLFAAVTEAGGTHVHMERADQEHLAVVKVPDQRLLWLEERYKPKKRTHAELEFLDVPGMDLSSEAGRQRARTHWQSVRNCGIMLLALRNFHSTTAPPYRDRVDFAADLDELKSEMLFADLEQVLARIEKLEATLKKPVPGQERDLATKELDLMQRLGSTLEAEKPISEAVHGPIEERLVRPFAFLTLKPALVVVNCDEGGMPAQPPEAVGGYPAMFLSAKLEQELAALDEGERAEFMKELGVAATARDRLIRACYDSMKLISFLTAGDKEVRAWTIPAGTDAVTAAGEIHTDIARGFIRAEIIAYDDLHAAGSEKAARAAGKFRLEGKSYIIKDGDVVVFRFNV